MVKRRWKIIVKENEITLQGEKYTDNKKNEQRKDLKT